MQLGEAEQPHNQRSRQSDGSRQDRANQLPLGVKIAALGDKMGKLRLLVADPVRPGPPYWMLGFVIALLGWRVGMNPPAAGLDASWNAGLSMAIHQGLQFGRQVVFTYGPLGFLQGQFLWYGDLAIIAFLYSATIYIAFCTALAGALRRLLAPAPTVLVAFLIVATLPLLEQSLLLTVLVCLGVLERRHSERTIDLLVLAGGSFAAVEALVKLSVGPVIVAVLVLALIGARARWWKIGGFVLLFLAELLLLWILAGQSISSLPAFLENTWQIVSGYSSAMLRQVNVPAWKVTVATLVAVVVMGGLVIASAQAHYRDRRARWCAITLMVIAAFATFKEGVVRTDAGHLSLYFSTACVLWIAVPWTRDRWRWMVAGAAVIAAVGIPVRPPGLPTNLNVIANVRYAADQVRSLLSESRRQELIGIGRKAMKATYRLDRGMRVALRGRSVAIEPWEIGVAWAYRLDWSPLPVFQNYSAYTKPLDQLNAGAVENAAGPQRILRENQLLVDPEFSTPDLDNRYLGWDPPAQARAVLCHFVDLQTTPRWQLLGRVPDRCGRPRFIQSTVTNPGSPIRVPVPRRGEVVFVRIQGAGVSGLERVSTLLLHARLRNLIVNGSASYRLIPETAADGLMLRGGLGTPTVGAFSQIPQAKTIAVTGVSGTLRLSFFSFALRNHSTAIERRELGKTSG